MATTTSSHSGLTIDQLRDRLKGGEKPNKKARPSVASDVRALLPDVQMKRADQWTWDQIANVLYGNEGKASAIRTAYNRVHPAKAKSKGKGKGKGDAKGLAASKSADLHSGGGNVLPSAPRPAASPNLLEKPSLVAPSSVPMADQPAARPAAPNFFGQLNDRGFGMNSRSSEKKS